MHPVTRALFVAASLFAAASLASFAAESFDRQAVVSRVADLLEEMYVDPKIGKDVADHLRRRQKEGAFDKCGAPSALADAVTKAMREVADDKHLYLLVLKDVLGKRRPDVPVYVVTSAATGSGCEAFAYTLQKHGRATVVGERTAGAGYNNVLMPAGDGFTASVSVARPVHPKTGKGWEKTGVEPDVASAAEKGVATAHREALQALLANTPKERRRAIEWALEGVRARENPVRETAAPLEAAAGHYGARELIASGGSLYYKSAGGRPYGPLLPAGNGRFLAGEDLRVTLERGSGGAVTALSVERPDGVVERFARRDSEPSPEAPCAAEKGNQP